MHAVYLAGYFLAICGASFAHATEASDAEDITIKLDDALGKGKSLVLYLRHDGEKITDGFALAPGSHRTWHEIKPQRFTLEGGAMTGKLALTLRPDPGVPKVEKPTEGEVVFQAPLNQTAKAGTYTVRIGELETRGAARGERRPPANPGHAGVMLELFEAVSEAAAPNANKVGKRIVLLRFTTHDGEARAGTALHSGGRTYGVWSSILESIEVKSGAAGKLAGNFTEAFATPQAGESFRYRFEFEARVIADGVAGRYTRKPIGATDEKPFLNDLVGEIKPAATEPANADYRFVLDKVLAKQQPIVIYASATDGVFHHGHAVAPTVTRTPMRVDVSKLTIDKGTLRGRIVVDQLIASQVDKPPRTLATINIDAKLVPGGLSGTHRTTTDADAQTSGLVNGSFEPPLRLPERFKLQMKFEDGMTGGAYWQNRIFSDLVIDGEKIVSGGYHSDHPLESKWRGKFVGGEIKRDGRGISGTLVAEIESGNGQVTPGKYRFEFDAYTHQTGVTGEFRTFQQDKLVRRGRLEGFIGIAD